MDECLAMYHLWNLFCGNIPSCVPFTFKCNKNEWVSCLNAVPGVGEIHNAIATILITCTPYISIKK